NQLVKDAIKYACANGSSLAIFITTPANLSPNQVTVRVCKTTKAFFGGVVGASTITSCSQATAGKTPSTACVTAPVAFVTWRDRKPDAMAAAKVHFKYVPCPWDRASSAVT